MFFFKSRYFYDRFQLDAPKGNFNLKITPEQLIFQFTNDVTKVFPEFVSLPHRYKLNFAKRVLKFLKQYQFIEKENVVLTNAHKVSIASSYVKLTLGYSQFLINTFDKIIIYPTAKYFPHLDEIHAGHFNPKLKMIMLALDEFERDIYFNADGKDVALHEFTHALCFEMLQTNAKHPNAAQFSKGFFLVHQWMGIVANSHRIREVNFIRDYAYANKLELVAVLIEMFFEKEAEFKMLFPQLYKIVGNMIKHPKIKF